MRPLAGELKSELLIPAEEAARALVIRLEPGLAAPPSLAELESRFEQPRAGAPASERLAHGEILDVDGFLATRVHSHAAHEPALGRADEICWGRTSALRRMGAPKDQGLARVPPL